MNFEIDDKIHYIFRNDSQTQDGTIRTRYTMSISKKIAEGQYDSGYILVSFRKGVELANKSKIKIKSAWLTFYKTKNGEHTNTVPYIFINEFELVNDELQQSNGGISSVKLDEIVLTEDDLPFL